MVPIFWWPIFWWNHKLYVDVAKFRCPWFMKWFCETSSTFIWGTSCRTSNFWEPPWEASSTPTHPYTFGQGSSCCGSWQLKLASLSWWRHRLSLSLGSVYCRFQTYIISIHILLHISLCFSFCVCFCLFVILWNFPYFSMFVFVFPCFSYLRNLSNSEDCIVNSVALAFVLHMDEPLRNGFIKNDPGWKPLARVVFFCQAWFGIRTRSE